MAKSKSSPPPQIDAESEYLKKLRFDESLRGKWIEVLFRNPRLLILMMIGIVVFGLYSFAQLPRELNPDVVLPAVNVITTLPGASPRDVEQLVTQKLEKAAPNLPNLDNVVSSSTQGVSVVTFQFLSSMDPEEAVRSTKEEIDLLIDDLPDDATEPRVEKINVNDQPFLTIALTGEVDLYTISRVADELKDELEQVNGIRRADLIGAEEEEVVVALDPSSLRTYHLSEQAVAQALRGNNLTFPTGNVTIGGLEYTLSLNSELDSLDKIRTLPLIVEGKTIQLGQVAQVYLRTKEITRFQSYTEKNNSRQNAVQVAIFKAENETITAAEQKSRQVINETLQKYPQVKAVDILNFTEEITRTFADLQRNFVNSIGLMFLVLTIFLGLRQATVAALSIPLVIMCTFVAMNIMGLSLNFLSLFSLLLALSLIGDDAIVMAQSTTAYGRKFNSIETGLMVFRDFFIPIWVGTITVVWSFVPLLLASGIIGEFIKPIPLVVTATLLSSTAIATLLNLPLNIVLRGAHIPARVKALLMILGLLLSLLFVWSVVSTSLLAIPVILVYLLFICALFIARQKVIAVVRTGFNRVGNRSSAMHRTWLWVKQRGLLENSLVTLDPMIKAYRRGVTKIVDYRRWRLAVFALVAALLVVSLVFAFTGLLKTEFFPKTDNKTFYINIEGPAGWTVTETEQVLEKVEAIVLQLPEVKSIQSSTGSNFLNSFGGGGGSSNLAMMTVLLPELEDRGRDSLAITAELRSMLNEVREAKITVVELSGGPPAGSAFQVNLKGESLEELERIAADFQKTLGEIQGTINIDNSLKLSAGQITIELNPQELAERGLSAQQVGGWLRTALSGSEATDTIIDNEDRDITLQLETPSQNLDLLTNLSLPSALGSYTVSEVATLRLENSPLSIEREDGRRVVRVTADVQGTTSPEVLRQFQEKVKDYDMPAGYTWDVGGANEENEKSVQSIIQAMGISFFMILVTMVLQLKSFRKAILVVIVIPLALIGVAINFTLFQIPLSFPALIGVLSLFGIVVNNALMMTEKINLNLEYGFSTKDAVVDASSSRLEAIFLSSFSSVVGLLPVTISDPLWRGLGGAIIAGLSVSGLLILFLLPAMYIEVYGTKETASSSQTRAKK
ncbi:MAG TPA: efflux RND transporter permease subunit [Vitreimonas sp.]|nr:efflux RND transporter permease subunit [Vitreimonas sp.]